MDGKRASSVAAVLAATLCAGAWLAKRGRVASYRLAPAAGCSADARRVAVLHETALKEGRRGKNTKVFDPLHPARGCGLRFGRKERATTFSPAKTPEGVGSVRVDTSAKHQTIEGFGGAFTEASAKTWLRLPKKERERVVELYWGETGIGYSLGRVHMNSCDFCVASYDFAPVDGDFELAHFDSDVTHDQAEMIPLMRAAKAATERRGARFKLFASPWSPPAWLKRPNPVPPTRPTITFPDNRSMLGSAKPMGLNSDPRYQRAWALYYSKFADAYAAQNLSLWGFTVQNEPEFSAPWEACRWNESNTAAFIADYLGPELKAAHPELLLFVFDHNRDHMVSWGDAVYGDANRAAEFVDGIAFHWYAGGLIRELDGAVAHYAVDTAAARFPGAMLLPSEGCNCPGVKDSDLLRAERYAHDILRVLKSGAVGWVDWNLLLDHTGGPNHLGNDCDAPLHASDAEFSSATVQSYYDVIGHFSKHVPPGSRRLGTTVRGAFAGAAAATATSATVGLELTLWPCEGPSEAPMARQSWRRQEDTGFLELVDQTTRRDVWRQYCVGDANDPNLQTVNLVNCQWGREHNASATGVFSMEGGRVVETKSNTCLGAAPGHDASLDGAPLRLGPCDAADATQRFDVRAGRLGSALVAADGRCVTAGWAFFQGVAFERPDGAVAVVVVNEAAAPALFELAVDDDVIAAAVGPHTVQTYVVTPSA